MREPQTHFEVGCGVWGKEYIFSSLLPFFISSPTPVTCNPFSSTEYYYLLLLILTDMAEFIA